MDDEKVEGQQQEQHPAQQKQQQQQQQQGGEGEEGGQKGAGEGGNRCNDIRCESKRLQGLNMSLTKRNDDVMAKLKLRGDREARLVSRDLNADLKRQNGALVAHIEHLQNHNDSLSEMLQKSEDGRAAVQMHRAAELLVKGLANAEEEVQALKVALRDVEEQRDSYRTILTKTNSELLSAQAYAQMNMSEGPEDRYPFHPATTAASRQPQPQKTQSAAPAYDSDIERIVSNTKSGTPAATARSPAAQDKGQQRSPRAAAAAASATTSTVSSMLQARGSGASGFEGGGSMSFSIGTAGAGGAATRAGARGSSRQVGREVPVRESTGARIGEPSAKGPRSSSATASASKNSVSSHCGSDSGGVAERKGSSREAMDFSDSDNDAGGGRAGQTSNNLPAGGEKEASTTERGNGGENHHSSVYDSDDAPSMFF